MYFQQSYVYMYSVHAWVHKYSVAGLFPVCWYQHSHHPLAVYHCMWLEPCCLSGVHQSVWRCISPAHIWHVHMWCLRSVRVCRSLHVAIPYLLESTSVVLCWQRNPLLDIVLEAGSSPFMICMHWHCERTLLLEGRSFDIDHTLHSLDTIFFCKSSHHEIRGWIVNVGINERLELMHKHKDDSFSKLKLTYMASQ